MKIKKMACGVLYPVAGLALVLLETPEKRKRTLPTTIKMELLTCGSS